MAEVPWGMLGNDRYGDCAWAGSAHEHMLLNKLAGREVHFTTANVLEDYGNCTGFTIQSSDTDNGTDMREQMVYRQNRGIVDSEGHRHLIGAYTWPDAGDFEQALQALWMLDFLAIGFRVPRYAMDQFNRGQKWDIDPDGDDTIEGGHYVPAFAYNSAGDLVVVTWGREHAMTPAFYERFCDQCCAIITLENLVNGKSPEGFLLQELQDDLNSL